MFTYDDSKTWEQNLREARSRLGWSDTAYGTTYSFNRFDEPKYNKQSHYVIEPTGTGTLETKGFQLRHPHGSGIIKNPGHKYGYFDNKEDAQKTADVHYHAPEEWKGELFKDRDHSLIYADHLDEQGDNDSANHIRKLYGAPTG